MLGDNIKRFRKEANLSQEALAEKLGVTRQSVSLWENNQSQPSIETLVSLSKMLNKTTDELLSTTQGFSTEIPARSNENKTKNSTKPLLIVIAVVLVLIGTICCLWLCRSIFSKNFSEDTNAIAAAEASVVKVFCYDHYGNQIATGSGVVLFHKDMIVTNYHVINNAYSIKISTDQDITYNVLGVWHKNEKQDIAILKLTQETTLTPLKIGDPTILKKGETVTAIGSPLGIKNAVSKGNLSARIMQGDYDILQFTAPISNGSSGGALFNEKGEVVGITYASFTDGQNLNLAIPIDLVHKLYQSRSVSMKPTPLEELYWENRVEEYYEFTYGKPIEVTLKQLKSNPSFYDNKYIKITSYVSSIYMFKEPVFLGIYLSNSNEVTKNKENDENKNTHSNFEEHPFLRVSNRTIKVNEGEKVEVIGIFMYWEKGEDFNDAPLEYSKAYIDLVYLNGIRSK